MQFPSARILIFAKAPVAGKVKTRLIPDLGADRALNIYLKLLERTLAMTVASGTAPATCWAALDAQHPVLHTLLSRYHIPCYRQQGDDLGQRMGYAVQQTLSNADAVILIGTDCPVLARQHLEQAVRLLTEGEDAVIGPAEDGGYVLLGLRRYHASLFTGIPWGGDQVLEMTRQRLLGLGWRWKELEPLWDLDRPEDVVRYQALLV